ETLLGGFRYIFSNKVVLGAISLDMFAVLMGGAVAMLPIYATDILHGGWIANGSLRAAPGLGAIAMPRFLTRLPIRKFAGRRLYGRVRLFHFHLALHSGAGVGGRLGHGQRDHPRDHHAALDARGSARARQCRQFRVYWRLQRAG